MRAKGESELPVAILGAGVTGLAAAYELAKHGRTVRLFEISDRIGGLVQSERDHSWLIEAGPTTLEENSPEIRTLIAELGLEAHKRFARPMARNRYILKAGRPIRLPLALPDILRTRLLSPGAKLRILAEAVRRPQNRAADVSAADLIRSHFGQEAVDYGLSPYVSGTYAGNPESLSAQHAFPAVWAAERTRGSILRAEMARAKAEGFPGGVAEYVPIISFSGGLSMLTRAMAARLPPRSIHLEASVEALMVDRGWKVVWRQSGDILTEAYSHVILALPASALAHLRIGSSGNRPLAELDAIDHPPMASTFLGYRRSQVRHPLDGFGLFIPPCEKRQILAVLFSSSLFPARAPDGHVALTVTTGGATRPDLGGAPPAGLLPIIQHELADLLGVSGEPAYVTQNTWARGIPQYNVGYDRFLEVMSRCERAHPGLLIGGQIRDGIGLPACLAAGRRLARRVLESGPPDGRTEGLKS